MVGRLKRSSKYLCQFGSLLRRSQEMPCRAYVKVSLLSSSVFCSSCSSSSSPFRHHQKPQVFESLKLSNFATLLESLKHSSNDLCSFVVCFGEMQRRRISRLLRGNAYIRML